MCPHLSLLFFSSEDVSTYLYVHLLFFILIIQSFFFIPKMCPQLSHLFVFFFFQDVSTDLYVNLLFFIYIIQSFFFIPRMCPHLSLLFVFFFSQDVSTYRFNSLLFFFYSHHLSRFDLLYQVIFFSSQGCVLTIVFYLYFFSFKMSLLVSM